MCQSHWRGGGKGLKVLILEIETVTICAARGAPPTP